MGIETYYLSKKNVSGVGGLFLLNQLQVADSSGGGKALLGSVVTENKSPFHTDYPVPQTMFAPRVLVDELEARREKLEIEGDIVLEREIAAGNENLEIEKNNSFSVGLGPFPAIPVNAKFQLDYSLLKKINITYGAGTLYQYIPMGYAAFLYEALKGKPTKKLGGKFLQKNAYISLIQLAKNWTVSFESTKEFTTDIEAQLDAYNVDSLVGGKAKIKKKSKFQLEASVKGDTYYVVGLMSTRWNELNIF